MNIYKNFEKNRPIHSLDDWKKYCPPEGGDKQWKDGRSAKELAKQWIRDDGEYLSTLIGQHEDFHGIQFIEAAPEYQSKFDDFRGKGRQHDLLVCAKDNNGCLLISVEAKVDEPFGKIIKDYYLEKTIEKLNGMPTKVPERIEGLLKNIFGHQLNINSFSLRYQLLHAVAGTLAEAKRRKIPRTILIINTFLTSEIDIKKHNENIQDLNEFVRYISHEKTDSIHNKEIIGPFTFEDGIKLHLMRADVVIRAIN